MVWNVGEGDAYTLLAQLLGSPLPRIERQTSGKPFFPSCPDLHFNLSHSKGLALCVLSHRPVGCDIELVRERSPGLFRYALAQTEQDWLRKRGATWDDFYTLWTLKEARVKCTGEGLKLPPRDIRVPLLEPGETVDFEGFHFTALSGENWRGALVEENP